MANPRERLEFRSPKDPKPTWALFPNEIAKQPGLVIVANAKGRVIATIDPVTRERRTLNGTVEAKLSPQGWLLPISDTAMIFNHAPRQVQPNYELSLARDRDPRSASQRERRKSNGKRA